MKEKNMLVNEAYDITTKVVFENKYNELIDIFNVIEKAAKNGYYSVVILNPIKFKSNIKELISKGFKVESGYFGAIINWDLN